MSTNLSVVPNEAVSSVGNAWIVCRSKSYAGRIYYFNTSTGETVWNLSEPEIQKAKAMTKILKSQSGFQPEDCPEPVHSPESASSHGSSQNTEFRYHKMTPAKIYNKQVINNQFTKPYSSELSNYVPNAIQLNIPVAPTFNGLWNLAPQPIFVAPTPVHQLQHFPNLNQVPVTTTAVSLSNRFKNVSNKKSPNKGKFGGKRNFKAKFNNNGPRTKHFNQKVQNKKKNMDLRFVISSKRPSFNNTDFGQPSNHPGSMSFGDMTVRNAHSSHRSTLKENNCNMLNDDDMWLEENLQTQGKTDILDATPLKSYLQIEDSHLWYIIADSDALLNNVNFLNILLNSDKQCRFIVPQIVVNIIQKATNSRFRTQAHRAVYFISQQVDANLATIVPHNEDDEGSTDEKHCIITCCSKLMTLNFHVIILTDSIELNVLKETGEMPILTISEIKKILSTSLSNEIKSVEAPNLMDGRNIKITIPNNKTQTNLNSPLEVKTDQVQVREESDVTVPETTNSYSIDSPSTNTDLITCMKKIDPCLENSKKTKNKGKNCKWYSRKPKRIDVSTKCNTNFDSNNSNFGSVNNDHSNEDNNENSIKETIEDTEISNRNKENISKEVSKEKSKEITECDNVMFEVTGQAMENYLKMKSEEWVSRFIQIMEEVLAQILQQEPTFVLETLPPPWTVYEATECIKRKFKSDTDIIDAATKLLNVLFQLGGLRGKIKNDLSPQEYMEMYSFGVYLIDALQGLLSNSEDLQIAAESLSKLLNDIQNPHLDPCNEDSFADLHPDKEIRPIDDKNDHQNELNVESIANESEKLEESLNNTDSLQSVTNTHKRDENTPDSPKLYNLRSIRNKVQDKEIVFIRHLDIESSFFSSLELRKNSQKGIFSRILSNNKQNENNESLENIEEALENNDQSKEMNGDNEMENEKEPTFIRNVTRCMEFEEKLKEKSAVPYDSWTHRSEDCYDDELDYESMEDGYYMDGGEEMYESDENCDEVLNYYDDVEISDSGDLSSKHNDNVDFKFFVQKMQINIRRAYSAVHEFCKNSYEKLSSRQTDKSNILLAEKTYLFIDNLCNTFNRILERETSDSGHKLQEMFKNKEFEGVAITEKDFEDYRSFINSCLVQGTVLRDSVKLIMDAGREVGEN